MTIRQLGKIILTVFLLSFFTVLTTHNLYHAGTLQRYRKMTLTDDWYRAHFSDGEMEAVEPELSPECKALYRNVMREVQYFPVPESAADPSLTVSYVDSWQEERNYKGTSGHEGTDIMASENKRGIYPVLSMTDGTITNLGWLEKGGYRVGITSDSGTYYYYAHLDSYSNIKEGDEIKAGEFLGYMGDSGYGKEGTKGKFPVHLHVGIYTYNEQEEISVNPYYILLSLDHQKLQYNFTNIMTHRLVNQQQEGTRLYSDENNQGRFLWR